MSEKKRNRDESTSSSRGTGGRGPDEIHQSSKEGKVSGAKKEAGTRHGKDPAPETAPTPGAFGDEERQPGERRPVGGPRQLDIEKLDLEGDEKGEDSGGKP